MQLVRPRHVRPVLGSYLKARSKRELTAPPPEEIGPIEIFEEPEAKPAPTVGRVWELDTFTAPVRGRKLRGLEKAGIALFLSGLIGAMAFMLRPVPLRDETVVFMRLAGTAPAGDQTRAADFARNFLQTLGADWSLRIFFQNLAPVAWPSTAARANQLVADYAQGFAALRAHGRVLAIDFPAPRAAEPGAPTGETRTLPCTLEFADGTALRAAIKVTRAPDAPRWSVLALSVAPVLP